MTEHNKIVKYYEAKNTKELIEILKSIESSTIELKKRTADVELIKELRKDSKWIRFTELYYEDEKNRLSAALTGVEPFRAETEIQLQQKLISIRHFKMFMNKMINNVEDDGLLDINKTHTAILNEIIESRGDNNGRR